VNEMAKIEKITAQQIDKRCDEVLKEHEVTVHNAEFAAVSEIFMKKINEIIEYLNQQEK